MTDIVERLYWLLDMNCVGDSAVMREAAAEIKRLRAAKTAALKIADERSKENVALRHAMRMAEEQRMSNKVSNIAEKGV